MRHQYSANHRLQSNQYDLFAKPIGDGAVLASTGVADAAGRNAPDADDADGSPDPWTQARHLPSGPGKRRAMMIDKIRPHHLERKAILYIRQSSAHQVLHSTLQYAMRDRLTALGRSQIDTIDDDLGRSAAGGTPTKVEKLESSSQFWFKNRGAGQSRFQVPHSHFFVTKISTLQPNRVALLG